MVYLVTLLFIDDKGLYDLMSLRKREKKTERRRDRNVE